MSNDVVLGVKPLGLHWHTLDPFLFCAHHNDAYPAGNERMGPSTGLEGRRIGMDFESKDGWSMYHGDVVPGFPRHPHRGFETITLARHGFIDHSDSLGATARFGQGDVQWMTAGRGIVHSEMFPLVRRDEPNPAELFQVWLNLPQQDKMVDPYFTMLWASTIPKHVFHDDAGHATEVAIVAGQLEGVTAPPTPPPNSWAARSEAEVSIWTLKMEPEAKWTLPAGGPNANRMLYFFRGTKVRVGGRTVSSYQGIHLRGDVAVELVNGSDEGELLLLSGRPIGEPISHYGPFVMNTADEIHQAIADYQRTGFGGWPWKTDDPVHPRDEGRFAVHADGRREQAP